VSIYHSMKTLGTIAICDSVTGKAAIASAKRDVETGRHNAAAAAPVPAPPAAAVKAAGKTRTVRFEMADTLETPLSITGSKGPAATREQTAPMHSLSRLTLRSSRSIKRLGMSVSRSMRGFASRKFGSQRFRLLDVMEAEIERQMQQQQQQQQHLGGPGSSSSSSSLMSHKTTLLPHPHASVLPSTMFSIRESAQEAGEAAEGHAVINSSSSSAKPGKGNAGKAAAAAAAAADTDQQQHGDQQLHEGADTLLLTDQAVPASLQSPHSSAGCMEAADGKAKVVALAAGDAVAPSALTTGKHSAFAPAAAAAAAGDDDHAGGGGGASHPGKQAEVHHVYSREETLEGPFGRAASEPFETALGPILSSGSSRGSARRQSEKAAVAAAGTGSSMQQGVGSSGSEAVVKSKRMSFVKRE
jgi:hypothetical protein